VPLLGEIEIDPRIRIGGDTGNRWRCLERIRLRPKSIYAMARAVASRLAEKTGQRSRPPSSRSIDFFQQRPFFSRPPPGWLSLNPQSGICRFSNPKQLKWLF